MLASRTWGTVRHHHRIPDKFAIQFKYDKFEGETRQVGKNYIWIIFSDLGANWLCKGLDVSNDVGGGGAEEVQGSFACGSG